VPTTIAVESRPVLIGGVDTGFEHLYLVKTVTDASGRILSEKEISGGPGHDGTLVTQVDVDLALSQDARGSDTLAQRHHTVLDLQGRDPEAVWSLMVQHASNIDHADLAYGLEVNSNTVVGSALHTVGINLGQHLPVGISGWEVPLYDRVDAMRVNDVLVGGEQADIIRGGPGDDWLLGAGASDSLWGGRGNDHLFGGPGGDYLNGGAGFDYARYDYATSGVIASLRTPALNTGEAAGDTYDQVEGLVGSSHNDALVGNGTANDLWGLSGDDILWGFGGSDVLHGGAGRDAFNFIRDLEAGAVDDVADFQYGQDQIVLPAALSGNTLTSYDAASGATVIHGWVDPSHTAYWTAVIEHATPDQVLTSLLYV
jgi:Ca2+-binding RTX toxin-like protein